MEEERRGTSRPATPLGTYCTSVWWRSGPLGSEEWTTALPLGPQGSPRAPRPESSPQESPIPPWLLDTSLEAPRLLPTTSSPTPVLGRAHDSPRPPVLSPLSALSALIPGLLHCRSYILGPFLCQAHCIYGCILSTSSWAAAPAPSSPCPSPCPPPSRTRSSPCPGGGVTPATTSPSSLAPPSPPWSARQR